MHNRAKPFTHLIQLIPTILWGFLLLYLTVRPASSHESILPAWVSQLQPDKWEHAIAWGLWYWVFYKTFLKKDFEGLNLQKADSLFILVGILFGALVEWLQWVTAWGRSAEWLDLVSDTLGLFVAKWWVQKKRLN